MKKINGILEGNLTKIIMKMTIPIILGNLVQTLYNLTDTFFVSQIGGTQVAAVTFVWPIVFLIISIGQGMSVAGVSIISKSIGEGKKEEIKEYIGQLFLIALILGIGIAIFGFIFTDTILKNLGIDGNLYVESSKYMKIMLLATPATFITLFQGAVRRSEGNTFRPLVVNLISITVNIILNPIFIFYLKMGITGAAIATLIARYGAMLFCLWELTLTDIGYKLYFDKLKMNKRKIKEIFRIAVPATTSQAMTSVGFILLSVYVKNYGYAVLAAYGIGNRIHSVFFQLAQGIRNTLAVIVGQNLGNNNKERILEAFKKSMILAVGSSFLGALIIQLFLKEFVTIFAKDPEIISNAMNYMRLVSWTVIAWAVFQVVIGFLQGLGDTKKALNINVFRLWAVRIPLVIVLYYLGMYKIVDYKEYSVWYSMFYSNLFTGLYSLYVYNRYLKNRFNNYFKKWCIIK